MLRTSVFLLFAILPANVHAQSGGCGFDSRTLSFRGSAGEQADCLLRKVGIGGVLSAQPVPRGIRNRVGAAFPTTLDTRAALQGLPAATQAALLADVARPVSQTASGAKARYFVIHDTSSPYLRNNPFPANLESDPGSNNLKVYMGANAVAHLFINRRGEVAFGHDFSVPWRATRLESRVVGRASRGRFLHIELLQPRRRDPAAGGPNNDRLSPVPGFGEGQYRSLAAAYLVASARAGVWLIPAFHAALDEGISGGHDDPQSVDITQFDEALTALIDRGSGTLGAAPASDPPGFVGRWGSGSIQRAWSQFALRAVHELGQALWAPGFVPLDISTYCPAYRQSDEQGKKVFWAALLSSLAKPESNFNPSVTFTENFNDSRGRPVISRGLLQISFESGNGYGCRLAREEELHDPETNLRCAVRVLNRQVPRAGVIAERRNGRWVGAASYWSPFRRPDRRADVASWVARQPYCA